jgi:hypothetical protein
MELIAGIIQLPPALAGGLDYSMILALAKTSWAEARIY